MNNSKQALTPIGIPLALRFAQDATANKSRYCRR